MGLYNCEKQKLFSISREPFPFVYLKHKFWLFQSYLDNELHEQELLIDFRRIWGGHLQRVAIKQVKAISKFNPEEIG
jgi:hypothetical protein